MNRYVVSGVCTIGKLLHDPQLQLHFNPDLPSHLEDTMSILKERIIDELENTEMLESNSSVDLLEDIKEEIHK